MNTKHDRVSDIYLPEPPIGEVLVIRRGSDGEVITNVPHRVVHHSPTGFEFGYMGSGPSDLALNIVDLVMHRLYPDIDHAATTTWDGEGMAYETLRVYHDFHSRVIATMDQQGNYRIPYPEVERWVKDMLAEHAEQIAFDREQQALMAKWAIEEEEQT